MLGDKLDVAEVSLGIVDDAQGEVLAGLDEGDKVVAGNVGTLGNGMQVQMAGQGGRRGGGAGGGRAAGGR